MSKTSSEKQYLDLNPDEEGYDRIRERITIAPVHCQEIDDLMQFFHLEGDSELHAIRYSLVECSRLTGCNMGFISFLSQDEKTIERIYWTNHVIEISSPEELDRYFNFPVEKTLFINECVHHRLPILYNPESDHAELVISFPSRIEITNLMCIPIFNGTHVEAVVGFYNKKKKFTNRDLYTVSLLMNSFWQLRQRVKFERANFIFKSIVKHSEDAIIGCTFEGTIRSWNRGAERLFQYRKDEVKGRDLAMLSYPDYPNELPLIFDKIKHGEPIEHYETVRMKKDGTKIYVSLTVSPIKDLKDQVVGISIIARDITYRKSVEKRISESEKEYRTIFENTGTALIIINEDATIELANREFEAMTGYTTADLGSGITGATFVVEEDIPMIQQYHLMRRKDPESAPRNYEFQIVTHDGTKKYIEITTAIIPGTAKSVASFKDITELKQLQLETLKSIDDEKTQIWHYIQDGLLPIAGNLNTIIGRIKERYAEKGTIQDEDFILLENLSERVISRTERIMRGLNPIGIIDKGLGNAVEELIKTFEQIREVSITASLSDSAHITSSAVSENLFYIIQEALLYAINNNEPSAIDIQLKKEQEWFTLTIHDNGTPPDPDSTFQTGMEFNIMRYRSSLIGAMIEIYYQENSGSTVLCRFKKSHDSLKQTLPENRIPLCSRRGADKTKILIADSQPVLRHGLMAIINKSDDLVACGEAESSTSTINQILKYKPDLVILDISIESGMGLELLKAVSDRFSSVPVLVLSTSDETIFAERVLKLGARGYVMKTCPIETIIEAIYAIIEGKIYLSKTIREKLYNKTYEDIPSLQKTTVDDLTNRELEVFQLIGYGYGPKNIAEKLCLSVKTVETYRERIKEKLDLQSASDLLQYAIYWNRQFSKDSPGSEPQ